MLERVGRFVGRLAADVVHVVRNRPQLAPCTVDWDDAKQSRYFGAVHSLDSADEECCDACDHDVYSVETGRS